MNSRQKGARGERELAKVLSYHGYHTRRGQQYSGANGDADVVGLPFIHIECKRVEHLNIFEAIEQSLRDARSEELSTVMHRKNGKQWLVTMTLEQWLLMYDCYKKEMEAKQKASYEELVKLKQEQAGS